MEWDCKSEGIEESEVSHLMRQVTCQDVSIKIIKLYYNPVSKTISHSGSIIRR